MTLWKGKHERRKNPFQKMTLVLPSLSSPIKLLTLFHSQREDRQEMIRAVAFVLVPSINKHFWTETHSSSPTVILSARTLNNLIACIPLLTRCVCEGEKGTDTSNQKEESKESISEWDKNSETKWDRDKESSVVVLGFHYPSLSRTIWECCSGEQKLAGEGGLVMRLPLFSKYY